MSEGLKTILIAEDDPHIQELALMALESVGGFSVIACDDGQTSIAKARHARPDLIILDWMMPRMNGGEALAALRADPQTRDIPVIFMTAKVRSEDIDRMRALGALDVIPKPFNAMDLPRRVQEIWERRSRGSA